MREVIAHFDFCSHLCLAVFVYWMARRAEEYQPRCAQPMWWAGIVVFLSVGALGFGDIYPMRPVDLIAVVVVSVIAACAAALATVVVVGPTLIAWDSHRKAVRERDDNERRRERDERERDEAAYKREEEERRRRERQEEAERRALAEEESRRNAPPPKTRSELIQEARERHRQDVADAETFRDPILQGRAKMAADKKLNEKLKELMELQ